jgi:hypothetical protein
MQGSILLCVRVVERSVPRFELAFATKPPKSCANTCAKTFTEELLSSPLALHYNITLPETESGDAALGDRS